MDYEYRAYVSIKLLLTDAKILFALLAFVAIAWTVVKARLFDEFFE